MLRPRVRSEHAPYRIAGGKIRIGWVSYGIAAEISGPDGWIWTMLTVMDGSHGVTEIVDHVHRAHPKQSPDVLRAGLEQLLASGYVEDRAGPVPASLTERDLRRYDRAVGFYRWLDLTPRASSWEPQAILREAKVTILGGYRGPLVQAGVFVPGSGSCWECNAHAHHDRNAKVGGRVEEDAPQHREAMFNSVGATSAGMSGYLAAHHVISLLTGIPPAVPGQVTMVNLAAIDASQVFCEPPHPACEACAGDGSL